MKPRIQSLLIMAAMLEAQNDHNVNENYTPIVKQKNPSWKRKFCKSCNGFDKKRGHCDTKLKYESPNTTACSKWTKRKSK